MVAQVKSCVEDVDMRSALEEKGPRQVFLVGEVSSEVVKLLVLFLHSF